PIVGRDLHRIVPDLLVTLALQAHPCAWAGQIRPSGVARRLQLEGCRSQHVGLAVGNPYTRCGHVAFPRQPAERTMLVARRATVRPGCARRRCLPLPALHEDLADPPGTADSPGSGGPPAARWLPRHEPAPSAPRERR